MAEEVGSWLQFIMVLVGIGALALLTLRQASSMKRMLEPKPEPKYYTVERCGDKEFKRSFQQGDYVGKVTGECEGGQPKVIVAIYSEEQPVPKRKGLLPTIL
ncbi:MAG: hypothetical protein F7B95_00605 [Desulfurococcales archaeon]|nr:hypothetical protein [Desulfurococcales archaeon]